MCLEAESLRAIPPKRSIPRTWGEEPVNQCHSKTSRRFLIPPPAAISGSGASPGWGRSGAEPESRCPAGGRGLTIAAGIRPGAGDAASPPGAGAGRVPVGSEPEAGGHGGDQPRLPAGTLSGRSRAPPARLLPAGGGVGASEGNPNSSSLACRSCPGCLCSGDGPDPGREGICHR